MTDIDGRMNAWRNADINPERASEFLKAHPVSDFMNRGDLVMDNALNNTHIRQYTSTPPGDKYKWRLAYPRLEGYKELRNIQQKGRPKIIHANENVQRYKDIFKEDPDVLNPEYDTIEALLAANPEFSSEAAKNIESARQVDAKNDLKRQKFLEKMRDLNHVTNQTGIDRPTDVTLVEQVYKDHPELGDLNPGGETYVVDRTEDPRFAVTPRDYAEYGKEMASDPDLR